MQLFSPIHRPTRTKEQFQFLWVNSIEGEKKAEQNQTKSISAFIEIGCYLCEFGRQIENRQYI